jgi:TPR repeat protein
MSENNRKDFDMEEDPFAGVPDFDPSLLCWGDEEIYDLVLSARDISELEGRTDISADDWLDATYHFDFEGKYEKAALCLTKAAELGDNLAKYYLAECYEGGKGVVQDYVKAAELYMEVSNCNEYIISHDFYPQCWSEYTVGSFYERGLLPDSTMEKAVEWYLRAEKDGSTEAAYKLAECYLAGKGVEQDYDMAAEMLDFAHHWSNGNDARSFTLAKALDGKTETDQFYICNILAECYLKGIGTDKDEEKAHEYHSKAEALEAKLKAETEAWAVSLDDDERPW